LSPDWNELEDNVVPEETSYVCTTKVPSFPASIAQSVCPSGDHASEIHSVLYVILSTTPPVWISQIMMAVWEVQAMERPSGE